jgi:hypothetical protein
MIMSDNNKATTVRSGIGFSGVLTIVFIVLKLIGIIEWSWVWVLAPLWMSWAIGLGVLLIIGIIALIIMLITYWCSR